MKKYFLFLNLISIALIWTGTATAEKKKYRYIKREHGVKMQAEIPMIVSGGGFNVDLDLSGSYAYNWRGMVEAGPYFAFDSGLYPFGINNWAVGIFGEYNFIKNRGRRKLIPSLGLNVGAGGQSFTSIAVLVGPYVSLKAFVDKRTAIVTTLTYNADLPIPMTGIMDISHNISLSTGFSYYFDFY